MDTPSLSQNTIQSLDVAKKITINGIELRTPTRRKPMVARQYHVRFSVDDISRSTKKAKEKNNCISWDETLYFDGNDGSVLLALVHQKQNIGHDMLVGTLTGTVGGILRRLKDSVLEEPLRTCASDGPNQLSGVTIKFALTTETRQDIGADELQAANTVNKAAEMVGALSPTPQIVDFVNSSINAGTNVVTELQTFDTTWGVLLQRIDLFNNIVGAIAEIHPYASLAWSVISAASQVLVNQQNRDIRVVRLAATMSDVFVFVDDAEPLKMVNAQGKTIKYMIQQVAECGYFITEYAKKNNFWTRTAKYSFSDVDTKIADYEDSFRNLKAAFLEGVALQSGVTVFRIMNTVQAIEESIDLRDIPYADGARYVQDKECLPGTREAIIREICDILNNPSEDAPRVCLLSGVAGSGKSAVAHSIARLYDGQKRLGSSYCFLRSDIARRNPQNFFSTIAVDLSDHDPQYKAELCQVVKNNRSLRTSISLSEQVKKLIIEPSKHLDTIGPLIIVVDALDESGDQSNRRGLLSTFFEQITENNFPTNLRFLITTRPESDILSALPSGPQVVHKQLGDVAQDVVDGDIEKFIRHSLRSYYTELEPAWPNQKWCRLLVHHSQHLFQWASTACKFIEGDGAIGLSIRERLKVLVQSKHNVGVHPLDDLYRTILRQLFTLDNVQHKFREVMAVVLALKEPLSLASLSTLFEGDPNIRDILKPLGSLLDGVTNEKKPIRPLHTSFRDFLLDDTRSSTFHVNLLPRHSLYLGRALLACMRQMLRFNICALEDSRTPNRAIPDLAIRVNKAIPLHLAYSCQYWMDHVQYAECTADLLDEVTSFFKNFFPYWLEAISFLTSSSSHASSTLAALGTCAILKRWAKGHEVATLAAETFQFIHMFAPIIRESTPHLYLSAMPQTPSGSPLCQLWAKHLQNHIFVTLGQPSTWPAEVHTLQAHTNYVYCVAYSPNGAHIVSGSSDMTIRIWDSITGQCVLAPHQAHTGSITSVAYSPNGNYIASGSNDCTIRIWDATTGQDVAGPFQHTRRVYSVVYSPDGDYVASGSDDTLIRIWNADSGECIAAFEGHTTSIHCLAYSPDGSHIVSGSYDKTLKIWDANTGKCIMGPLHGHTQTIKTVSYSPDGNKIASGSPDGTIRIWDSSTGECVGFIDNIDSVESFAYSPDGGCIVSGSEGLTIRVWDSITGQCVAGPFQGHTRQITSVGYSPDGSCVVSGSWDMTVRIWNVNMGQDTKDELQGHEKGISSVAYSPNGHNIISGSLDRTVRIWDASTGESVADPLQGQHSGLYAAVSSLDGNYIASGSFDNHIMIWDVRSGQCVGGGRLRGHTNSVNCLAFSPDSIHVVSGSDDQTIRVWDVHSGQYAVEDPLRGHTSWVYSVAYSPNGCCIVSGSKDNTIRVWDPTTGECMAGPFEGHTNAVHSVAYSPDGSHVVSGSWDKTIRVWNPITGQCVAGPFMGHTDLILSVAYSPDGNFIVSGSEDRSIRIWNVTGECTASFQGHTSKVTSVAFSPDGSQVVSGSADFSIKVWTLRDLNSFGEMHQQDNGWIELSDGGFFCWIPTLARHAFYLPVHALVISPKRIYKLDCSNFMYGESWKLCWK